MHVNARVLDAVTRVFVALSWRLHRPLRAMSDRNERLLVVRTIPGSLADRY
jgi:hypothetical protein